MEKVKIQDYTFDIKSIFERPPLLEIQFNDFVDLSNVDLSLIEVLTCGDIKCREFTEYTTIYKYIDDENKVILSNDGSVYIEPEVSEPIKFEPYMPTEKDLENAKINKIKQSKLLLEQHLLKYPLLYKDGYNYSVTLEKQNLLVGNLMAYQLELQMGIENPTLEWNSVGEECVNWTYENLSELAITIKTYVKPFASYQRTIEKQINNCTSIEEVNNVVINYETII